MPSGRVLLALAAGGVCESTFFDADGKDPRPVGAAALSARGEYGSGGGKNGGFALSILAPVDGSPSRV